MSDRTPDPLAGAIVPGHVLYAQIQATQIISESLSEWGIPNGPNLAAALLARLAANEPPILLGTEDEFAAATTGG